MRQGSIRWLTVVGAALLLVVGGAVAYAQIPSADGVITACYTRSGGAMRIIDADSTNCTSKETKLTWNQKGQPGANGTNGAAGQDGVDGTDGTDGDSAYAVWLGAGNTGSEADFIASLQGDRGVDGADGADGLDGTTNTYVVTDERTVLPGTLETVILSCNDANDQAVGMAVEAGISNNFDTVIYTTNIIPANPPATVDRGVAALALKPIGGFGFGTTTQLICAEVENP